MSIPRARHLRRTMTDAERLLWRHLRDRQLAGHKFRRQVPIGRYIADFLCQEARLIVEVDGSQHTDRLDYDAARTEVLERLGYRGIRFWNPDVLHNTEGVLATILNEIGEDDS